MSDDTAQSTQPGAQAKEEETGGTGLGHRTVSLSRTAHGEFAVTNARGGTLQIGTGETADFTPVELLLTAIAGCSAVDVDFITSRRAEPEVFEVLAEGDKIKDEEGNRMDHLEVSFRLRFPEGEAGDRARAMLPRAVAQSRDRLCTVSRTVQVGTPITMTSSDA